MTAPTIKRNAAKKPLISGRRPDMTTAGMAVAALPDGRRALSASADKTLKLWDLETGNPLAAFTADSDLFAVATAANDRFVAGSHDGRLDILRHLT